MLVSCTPVTVPLKQLAARLTLGAVCWGLFGWGLFGWGLSFASSPELPTHRRRPVALATMGGQLIVGNRRSGTLSVVSPPAGVVAEFAVAERLADMCATPAGILVLDDLGCKLRRVQLRIDGSTVTVAERETLATLPAGTARLVCDPTFQTALVTAPWSRRVFAVPLAPASSTATGSASSTATGSAAVRELALPFAPRELVILDGGGLLVADAFGNQLAQLALPAFRVEAVRRIKGHNIRGLALAPGGRQLYVAHQHLQPGGRADYEELHWGRLLTNAVEVFDLPNLLAESPEQLSRGWLDEHGGIGNATADPGQVLATDELVAVALTGVGEVALRQRGRTQRLVVGAHPSALAVRGEKLYVANQFDDTLSVIDLGRGAVAGTIDLGPAPPLTAVERGERLFYDAGLSHDGWMSCHSCHTDGHSSGLLVDTLGDGDYGAPKRVPSLLGTAAAGPWGWDGKTDSLAAQVRKSITTTMHGELPKRRQVADLVAYLESLRPPLAPAMAERIPKDPGVAARSPQADRSADLSEELQTRGRQLFAERGCAHCHAPPNYTSREAYDVGLADVQGRTRFNPPALRGVAHRTPLLHDGRVADLEELLGKLGHPQQQRVPAEDLPALLAFLRSL